MAFCVNKNNISTQFFFCVASAKRFLIFATASWISLLLNFVKNKLLASHFDWIPSGKCGYKTGPAEDRSRMRKLHLSQIEYEHGIPFIFMAAPKKCSQCSQSFGWHAINNQHASFALHVLDIWMACNVYHKQRVCVCVSVRCLFLSHNNYDSLVPPS